MKRLLAIIALPGLIVLATAMPTLAEHSSDARAQATSDATNLTRLKGLANKEVTHRLGALNALEAIVKNAKCLSAADRAKLEAEIEAEQTSLPTLKTKIDNDTDDATAKTDVESIKTDFRVFALMVPKVHLLRVADHLTCAITKITAYADKLQTHIDTARAAGKDVTTLQTTMTDMRAQIQTATADFTSAKDTILNTTPDQFNASPTIVNQVKATLDAGRQALIKALKDGNTIHKGLVALGQ